MRSLYVTLALALSATGVQAQNAASPPAADSNAVGESGFEFRLGGIYMTSAERNYYYNKTATSGTGNLGGGEGLLRGSGGGISGQALLGSISLRRSAAYSDEIRVGSGTVPTAGSV